MAHARARASSLLVALDIETDGLRGDVVFWSWSDGRDAGGEAVAGREDFTRRFAERFLTPELDRAIFVAHYGMSFDFLRFDFRVLMSEGFRAVFWSSPRFEVRGFDLDRDGCRWHFRDSSYWCRGSLESFSALFGSGKKKEGGPDFESGETFNPKNPAHVEYAIRDAMILHEAARGYRSFLSDRFGVSLHSGITDSGHAAAAFRAAVRRGGDDLPSFPASVHALVRESVSGGLIHAYRVGKFSNVALLDINSSYPSIMLERPLPVGDLFVTGSPPPSGPYLVGARVTIPRTGYPVLAARVEGSSGHLRTVRAVGEIEGLWWNEEVDMQCALAPGCVVKPYFYVGFSETTGLCRDFISSLAELRRDPNPAIGEMAKNFQNALAGKFGQAVERWSVVLSGERPAPDALPWSDGEDDPDDLDHEPRPPLWIVPRAPREDTLVPWWSYIVSQARVRLLRLMMRVPQERWIYAHTDAFVVSRDDLPLYADVTGPDYGQLKVKFSARELDLRSAGVYRASLVNGGSLVAARGIPVRDGLREEAMDHGTVRYDRLVSLRMILRDPRGPDYGRETTRAVSESLSLRSGRYLRGVWVPERVIMPENIILQRLGLSRRCL